MKQEKLSESSTGELLTQQKSIKVVTGMLVGVLFVLFCATLFLTIRDGFNVLMVVPIALFPIVVLNWNTLNEIKKELKSRE